MACINAGAMTTRSAALAIALFACGPATGGETPWQEIAPGVQLRLITSGEITADGTTYAALEIDMPANTKTYWRVPGETGLPLEIDLAGSSGVASHKVHWPYPERQKTGEYLDYVYHGPTVLPLELEAGAGSHLEMKATLGICSDICMPAQAAFSIALAEPVKDAPNSLRIRQALAETPVAWTEPSPVIGDVALTEEGGAIAVKVLDPRVDAASLIAATVPGEPVFGVPQKSPEPNLVLIPILGAENDAALVGEDVQLTFMTEMGAFEVTRPVEPTVTE